MKGIRGQGSGIRRFLVRGLLTVVCGLFLTGYAKEPGTKITGYDDFGRKIVLPKIPERIVVVSGTYIPTLFELGVGEKIVGVPNSIIKSKKPPYKSSYPGLIKEYPDLLEKPTVGDFSSPSIEKIIALKPDLVIIYDSSDTPGKYSSIFEKTKIVYAAFTTPVSVEFGLLQIKRLGILLGKRKEARILANRLKNKITALTKIASKHKEKPLVWWSWGGGMGTYGKKTVIDELINKAGGINIAHDFDKQYFELSYEYVIAKDPDLIIVSCYQEDEYKTNVERLKDDPRLNQIKAIKNGRVYPMDGHKFHCPIRYPEVIAEMREIFEMIEMFE